MKFLCTYFRCEGVQRQLLSKSGASNFYQHFFVARKFDFIYILNIIHMFIYNMVLILHFIGTCEDVLIYHPEEKNGVEKKQ
jgi:hypothetical protein